MCFHTPQLILALENGVSGDFTNTSTLEGKFPQVGPGPGWARARTRVAPANYGRASDADLQSFAHGAVVCNLLLSTADMAAPSCPAVQCREHCAARPYVTKQTAWS